MNKFYELTSTINLFYKINWRMCINLINLINLINGMSRIKVLNSIKLKNCKDF